MKLNFTTEFLQVINRKHKSLGSKVLIELKREDGEIIYAPKIYKHRSQLRG